jgi:hypothetical protein
MKPAFWTAERVRRLMAMWAQNMRVQIIADHLGCTRNMVIGKANRLRLPRVGRDEISRRQSEGHLESYERRRAA